MLGVFSKNRAANAGSKRRSALKLGLLAAALLVAAGGGYAGWSFFLAGSGEAGAATTEAHDGAAEQAPDPLEIAALHRAARAESSFTHTFALSVLITDKCGESNVPALRAASEAEAMADGLLANLSWLAAARRVHILNAKSCGHLLSEVDSAEAKALKLAEAKAKAEGKTASAGH